MGTGGVVLVGAFNRRSVNAALSIFCYIEQVHQKSARVGPLMCSRTMRRFHLRFTTRRTRGTGIVVFAKTRFSALASEASDMPSSISCDTFKLAIVPVVSFERPLPE